MTFLDVPPWAGLSPLAFFTPRTRGKKELKQGLNPSRGLLLIFNYLYLSK